MKKDCAHIMVWIGEVSLTGIVLLGGGYYLMTAGAPTEEPVACTMDAKECPDGSYVGRQPPSCEFAACPSVSE